MFFIIDTEGEHSSKTLIFNFVKNLRFSLNSHDKVGVEITLHTLSHSVAKDCVRFESERENQVT